MGGSNPQPKKFQKNKSTFVYNISPSTSNLQMILYNKKMEDLSRKNNPDFIFKEFHQKESRRMLVEYLKIYRNNNIPLTTFMKKENINPLVILKEKNEEQISENKNGFNNDDIYNSNYFSKNEINESNSKSFMSKNKELTENNSKAKLKNINSFKILSAFLNDVNDESQEKELLIFLSIPRILRLISSNIHSSASGYLNETLRNSITPFKSVISLEILPSLILSFVSSISLILPIDTAALG